MGTTAQKLQAVLDAKNAIKTKFDLPDDMPFSQYADNIKAGDKFYKCSQVFGKIPLRLTAVKDGTKFAFLKISNYFNATEYAKWKFRTNTNPEWQSCDGSGIDDHYNYKFLTMAAGDWIEVEGNTANCAGVGFNIGSQKDDSQGSYNMLASGNVMSLLNYSDTVPKGAFYQLFQNCPLSSLPDISKIHIIGEDGCRAMFNNYNNTYSGDIVLNLQSVGFAACYEMFYGNWWWVTPSTTPTMKVTLKIEQFTHNEACRYMFGRCKYLNEIKFYNDNWATNYSNTFASWVEDVAGSGTFYKVSALPTETGTSRIPSAWTVEVFNPATNPIPTAPANDNPLWNGYEMIKKNGAYIFSDTVTEGLTYSEITPQVGGVYNYDASIVVEKYIEFVGGNDTPDEPSEPENPDTPDELSTGNLVLAGWQDSLPTMGGGATVTSVNGIWTKGRWSGNTGFTEDSTAEGQAAAYRNADGTGIISYYSSRWYLDPNGYVGGYAAIETSTTGDENPYNADGTSLTWNSSEGFTTGTVLPEQGGGEDEPTQTVTAPVLHFTSYEHPALPGDMPSREADGDYYLVDPTAEGWYRVWKHESKDYYISAYNDGMDNYWNIASVPNIYPTGAATTPYAYIQAYSYPDPWLANGTSDSYTPWEKIQWAYDTIFKITMTEETYEVGGATVTQEA